MLNIENNLSGGTEPMGKTNKGGREKLNGDDSDKKLSKKELKSIRKKEKAAEKQKLNLELDRQRKQWQTMFDNKINNFSIMDLASLNDSKRDYEAKLISLKKGFVPEENIKIKLNKLLEDIRDFDDDLLVDEIKEEYIEIFEKIVAYLNERIKLSTENEEPRKEKSWMKNMLEGEKKTGVENAFNRKNLEDKKEEEIKNEIENMDEKERIGFFEKISNVGFGLSFARSKAMGSITKGLTHLSKKNDYAHKFFEEYTNFYNENAEASKEAIFTKGKNKKENFKGALQGSGTAIKTYRVFSDLAQFGTTRALNPFRHVTVGAMFVGRSAEILKRSVVKREDKIEKNRIEDLGEAMTEAEKIFKIKLKEEGSTNLSKEDLEKAYKENIPRDIIDRIERGGGLQGTGLMQYLFKQDAKGKANRVLGKLDKIDKKNISDEKKEKKRTAVFSRYGNLLEDLDKMISHEGAVDNLSYTARTMEDAGKKTANVFVAETIFRLANTGFNMHLYEKAWDKGGKAYEELTKIIKDKFSDTIVPPVDLGKDYSSIIMEHESGGIPEIDGDKVRNVLNEIKESHKPAFSEEELADAPSMTERAAEDQATESIASGINKGLGDNQEPNLVQPEENTTATMNADLKLNSEGVPVVDEQLSGYSVPESSEDREYYLKEARKGISLIKQIETATIQSGSGNNSVEGVFIKQLMNNPKDFGFTGDTESIEKVRAWANGEAHRIASDNGYFDKKTGQGVWMKSSSIGHNAYVLNNNDGKIGVDEYLNGELHERHAPGENFEDGNIEANEKIHDPQTETISKITEQNTVSEPLSLEQKTFLSDYAEAGVTEKDLFEVGIDVRNEVSEAEGWKNTYFRDSLEDGMQKEKIMEIIQMADKMDTNDFASVREYYYQLNDLSGNSLRQNGLLDVLKDKNYRQGFSKVFNLNIVEGRFIVENGISKIKDVYPNFDIAIKNDGGTIKFGIDGPMGWNWGANGRSFFFKADAGLTNHNINKAIAEIKKMSESYNKK